MIYVRSNGAMVTRWIPVPKIGGLIPSFFIVDLKLSCVTIYFSFVVPFSFKEELCDYTRSHPGHFGAWEPFGPSMSIAVKEATVL